MVRRVSLLLYADMSMTFTRCFFYVDDVKLHSGQSVPSASCWHFTVDLTETDELASCCRGAAVVVEDMENEVDEANQRLVNPDQARGRMRSLQAQLVCLEKELSVHKSRAGLWQTDAAQAWQDR